MPASRPFRRAAWLAALLVGSLVIDLGPNAYGQTPEPEGPSVTLELVGQPVWHGPDDPLDLRLRVTNEGLSSLEGFRLQVRAYSRSNNRTELHDNFEVDPLRIESSSLPVPRRDVNVPAGTSADVAIDAPVSALTSLIGGPPGVYPITITVTDADGSTALDSVTTQLLYFPEEVEVPLNVVVLWPLVDIPSRRARGSFVPADDAPETGLELATAPEGWLTGILDALEGRFAKRLRLGLAPGPRLVEELGDMADGGYRVEAADGLRNVAPNAPEAQAAAGTLARLRALAAEERLQTMHMPYAFSELTTIDDFEQLSAQLNAARSVLEERLEIPPDSAWLFAPGGRLDEVTLERLRSSEAAGSTFFAADTLEPEPAGTEPTCRQDFIGITYTCPVRVTTATGSARGFVLDAQLQQRAGALVSDPGDIGEMQKFFAEIAMIWAELPTPTRVLPLAVPPLWHPPPSISARFVRTITRAPWIRARTPRRGLHLGIEPIARELVTEAPRGRLQPDTTYLDDMEEAAAVVESFSRIRPPITLVQRLRRDVLTGHSLLWSSDEDRLAEGATFADAAQREAEDEFDKISIAGKPSITLASRRGTLPLSLQNGADYPVTLEIHLESRDRALDLSDRTVEQTFEPGVTPLSVQVSARASGIYPVGIRVLTSDGYEVSQTSISIRSTEFNEIALAITVGALVFLLGFSTIRGTRRRRAARRDPESTS